MHFVKAAIWMATGTIIILSIVALTSCVNPECAIKNGGDQPAYCRSGGM